ncbi:MAG: shikimate kinase [Sulfurimonadaceae bacterium]|nr:shikimate kinase [Sulfurimonadaceae bacterium]
MQNIVLVGFMGVGKGSVAREVIKQSEYIAIDTDDIIESMENRKVKKIFEEEGEPYFREIERKVATWLATSVQNTLISTGGGFFKVPNIKKVGRVVLLHAEFDTIYNRILAHPNAKKKIKKRPLLKDKEKARELYNEREAQYMKVADIVVDVTDKSVEAIAKEILEKV